VETQYLIIGGGPAGVAAAEAIRSKDTQSSVLIIDAESEPLYSKISFHRFLDGTVGKDKLYLRTIEYYKDKKIDFIRGRAVSGDAKAKKIVLEGGEEILYQKLIIATGGRAKLLDIEGSEELAPKTFYNLQSALELKDASEDAERILVIGGGFLTLDLLDGLVALNKKITLIMRDSRILENKIGERGSVIMEKKLLTRNVEILRNEEVSKFEKKNGSLAVLKSGREISFDIPIIAVGLEVNLELARVLGLKTDRGVVVDRFFATSDSNIYACGDVCQYEDIFSGESNMAGNWFFAQESGKTAGLNALGERIENSSSIIVAKNIFGLSLYFSGSINSQFESRDFTSGEKYFQIFIKDEKIVGISALNMADQIPVFSKLLGNPLDENALPKI